MLHPAEVKRTAHPSSMIHTIPHQVKNLEIPAFILVIAYPLGSVRPVFLSPADGWSPGVCADSSRGTVGKINETN